MSQKLPFNQVAYPFFTPQGYGNIAGVPFHRIEGDSSVLWKLHVWVAVNLWTTGVDGFVTISTAPVGSGVDTDSADSVGAVWFPDNAVDATVYGRILKVVDGFPLRGPMDLYAAAGGGLVAPLNPVGAPAIFGYITRGEGVEKPESRFFEASEIGDQVSDFSGGKAIGTINNNVGVWPPAWVDIHETDDTYIDDITLDMMRFTLAPMIGAVQFSAYPALNVAPTPLGPTAVLGSSLADDAPMRVRVLDGIPVLNAGSLQVQSFADTEDPLAWNGWYTRG